jgi:hypothetical protein
MQLAAPLRLPLAGKLAHNTPPLLLLRVALSILNTECKLIHRYSTYIGLSDTAIHRAWMPP